LEGIDDEELGEGVRGSFLRAIWSNWPWPGLGLAFKSVDAFMNNVVNPLIGAIVGKPNLDNFLTITVREGTSNQATSRSALY
jgi:hypothetical protein